MTSPDIQHVRQAIIEALPIETSTYGAIPDKTHIYLPPSHVKALRLECNLVIGSRGVGKTFWSAALHSPEIREILGKALPELSTAEVHTGFGERPDMDAYPDGELFGHLLSKGYDASDVWRAVLARWLSRVLSESIPIDDWKNTVDWVKKNPEASGRMLERANAGFEEKGKKGLIVFDALDLSSRKWETMDDIVRDLLRTLLSLKRFPRLYGKVFLREDQFSGRQVMNFPDASKLISTRVELTWSTQDLHGLLWQYLCNGNGEHGKIFREIYKNVVGVLPLKESDNIWNVSDAVKRNANIQRSLFVTIAGHWMGRDKRRGVPYTWSVGHLADGRGRTSPRSFLAAIRWAAEDSLERYPDHSHALHYESIKRGVQKASEIRVSELMEDYPWITLLTAPLRGMNVPCSFDDIEQRWMAALDDQISEIASQKLPPEHFENGWSGIRGDLEALGIFEALNDGRVNMPDLYRVGFGLGRRGGVKPRGKS